MNKTLFTKSFYAFGILLFGINASGMGLKDHVAGMTWLDGATEESATSVSKWMDNPANKTGEYINRKAGGKPVHPTNHNALRHNPENVARALSGTGKVAPLKLNLARMHKLQDMANNKSPVDGWALNSRIQVRAQELIEYVQKKGLFPKKLPQWVDNSGPGIVSNTAKRIPATPALSALGKTTGKAVCKAIPVVAGVIPVGIMGWELKSAEERFLKGEITEEELEALETEIRWRNTCSSAGAYIVGGICVLLTSESGPGAIVIGVGGGIVGGLGGDYLGGKCAEALNSKWLEEAKYTRTMNDHLFKNTTLRYPDE